MACRNGNIPDHCDKIMFAEDVVSWFMIDYYDSDYRPLIGSQYREFIYEAFNSTIRSGMICLFEQVDMDLFADEDPPTRRHYKRYSRNLRRLYFRDGFDAKLFLIYSVNLMSVLGKLLISIGIQEAGDLAVRCILKAFENRDMLCGGWDTLTAIAQKIVSIEDYADSHTPNEGYSPTPEDVIRLSSSSDEQDSDDDNLDRNGVSNNLEDLKTWLEVNQQVNAERSEIRKPSDSIQKEAFFSTAKSDDIEDNLEQMKSSNVESLGLPSTNRESNLTLVKQVPVKDLSTSECENNERSFDRKPPMKMDNGKFEVIKIELSNSVEASKFGLSQVESNDEPQKRDFANPVLTSELENHGAHFKRQQSLEQDHNKSVQVPGLGLVSSQNKYKVNRKHISVYHEQSLDSAHNLEQIRTQLLPSRDHLEFIDVSGSSSILSQVGDNENPKADPFANRVLTSAIEKSETQFNAPQSQRQDHNGLVEVPRLGSISSQCEEEGILKRTSICNDQYPDFTNNPGQPKIQLSPTRDHIKLIELSGSISMSSNFENKENLEKYTAIEQQRAPDSRNGEVCLGEKCSIEKDKELIGVPLSSPTSSQVAYKECSKTDYAVKMYLASDYEKNAMPFEKRRSPKRDHKGSVIFKKEQNLGTSINLDTSLCMSRDVVRNISTLELIPEDKIELSIYDDNSFDSNKAKASNISKLTKNMQH